MFCSPYCFNKSTVVADDVAPVVEEGAAPPAVGAGDGAKDREWYQVRVDEKLSLQASGHCNGGDPKLSPLGLALATVTVATGEGGKPVARARMGCGGLRQCGKADNKCEIKDLWHLGSDGKAMTSMLCAIFVSHLSFAEAAPAPCEPDCPAIDWVSLEAGTFTMGDPRGEGDALRLSIPPHQVQVSDFLMSRGVRSPSLSTSAA